MRILVVDDTRTVHTFVRSITKGQSYEFEDVFNGAEALEFLKQDCKFDAIFLDWEMPVMAGPETLKELSQIYPQIPVIMMTTRNAFEDIAKMLELGAKEYMMKPFTIDILQEKLESVVGAEVTNAS